LYVNRLVGIDWYIIGLGEGVRVGIEVLARHAASQGQNCWAAIASVCWCVGVYAISQLFGTILLFVINTQFVVKVITSLSSTWVIATAFFVVLLDDTLNMPASQ
jgi:hypothetical protein